MAGKIIGIALLGLTQIITWIVMMYLITFALSGFVDAFSENIQNGFLSQYTFVLVFDNTFYLSCHHVGSYGVWRTVSRSIIVGVLIDSYDCMYYLVIGNNLQVYNFIYR